MKSQQVERRKDGTIKKGFSGNPEGRKIGSLSIVTIIRKELEKIPDGHKESYAILLVKKLIKKGIVDGDFSSIKEIINRVDGMPDQKFSGEITNTNFNTDVQTSGEEQDQVRQAILKSVPNKRSEE